MKVIVILLLNWMSSVSVTRCTGRQMETFAVQGQAARLDCDIDEEDTEDTFTYSWTKDNHTINTSPRLLLQDSSLWLLNTVLSDSGDYVCTSTNGSESTETSILLSVEKGQCPRAPETKLALEGTNISLACTEDPTETLGKILHMEWLKDCKPTGMQDSKISLHVSMSSVGNYTCMVIFRYNGQNYTVSSTIELKVVNDGPTETPKVIYPRNHTVHTKPGVKTKLECSVFIGSEENDITESQVYWMVNQNFTVQYPQLQENLTIETRKNNQIYGTLTLFISEVLPEFFEVPFECTILSPRGMDMGVVWLKHESPYTIQTPLIILLVLIAVVVVNIVLFVFFRTDIILCYRQLCGKSRTGQTMVYNAYVCSCHGNTPGSTAEDLALRILPEVLEQKHDLKLFIHGRDDASTAENVADMTDVLSQSKTVLLILPGSRSANQQEEESAIPLNPGQETLDVSHCREHYSVIAQSSVPVIVVEDGENADYSLLPESIQSIIQRDRVLRWSPAVQPNGRFWKHLRYHIT